MSIINIILANLILSLIKYICKLYIKHNIINNNIIE